MEKDQESIYFIYPRNFPFKLVKQVLQEGFLVSQGTPSLMADPGVQTFTEEDVAKFGIEQLCKNVMGGNNNLCVVLRIPKVYLGLDSESNIDMSPIFCQKPKSDKLVHDSFMPMHGFIYGVYSPLVAGYVSSPNYSPVCNCYGILTDEQRKVAETFVNGNDSEKAMKYYDMLVHDSKVRQEYPDTSVVEELENADKKKQLEDYYCNNPNLVVAKNVWTMPDRHKITDEELNAVIAMNQARSQ